MKLGNLLVVLITITCLSTSLTAQYNFPWQFKILFGAAPNSAFSPSDLSLPASFILDPPDSPRFLYAVDSQSRVLEFSVPTPSANISTSQPNTTWQEPGNRFTTTSICKINQSFIVGAGYLLRTGDKPYNFSLASGTLPQQASGLDYNPLNGLLYASLSTYKQVFTFNITPVGNNLTINPNLNFSGPLTYPRHIRIKNNDIWVADSAGSRVVCFKDNNPNDSIVLGQLTINSGASGVSVNLLSSPWDIVFSLDYSVAFVADGFRVLRFRAPFMTGQSAEGVLGANDFNSNVGGFSSSLFGNITKLQLQDYGNGSGLLYISDYTNHRIIAGLTQWQQINQLACEQNYSTPYACVISQPVKYNSTFQFNYTTLIIASTFTLENTSTTIISANQSVQSTGNMSIGGSLTLILTPDLIEQVSNNNPVTIPLFSSNSSIQGSFSDIIISGEDPSQCGFSTQEVKTAASMAVLIKPNECEEKGSEGRGGLSAAQIAGIVIGVLGGVFCLILILVVMFLSAAYVRSRYTSGSEDSALAT